MTNAGLPIQIDGREYQLTLLGQADKDYLVNCMRAEFIAMGKEAASDEIEVAAVRRQAFAMSWFDVPTWIGTFYGLVRLLWLLLHKANPSVTVEQCQGWLEKRAVDMSVLREALQMSLLPPREGDGGPQAGNAPPKKRKQPKRQSS